MTSKDKYKTYSKTVLDYSFPISWAKKNKDYLRGVNVWTHKRIVNRKGLASIKDESSSDTSYEAIINELEGKL